MKKAFQALLLISVCFLSQCKSEERNKSAQPVLNEQPGSQPVSVLNVSITPEKPSYRCGDILGIEMDEKDSLFDSIQVYTGSGWIGTVQTTDDFKLNTLELNPGIHSLRTRFYKDGKMTGTGSSQFLLLSDIIPTRYTFRIKKSYPHDKTAYTQGFEFHNGYFFEGTGTEGKSSLRKVDVNTGEVLKFRSLPAELFGEGITRIGSQIFQVTYRSQVGFVYDAESFDVLRKIYYQNKEGWGLTNNGKEIIMSDGTNKLFFMDTVYFSPQRTLSVYDNEREVGMLNELEFINGRIYANRYLTDEIVIIDPESGKVEGKIDLTGILPQKERDASTDVLNGIAYDREGDRIFVTGKNWPKVYQVEFIKAN